GLALAAVALMAMAPNEVVGVSFQMSFAAVLALISGYEALRPVLARLHGDEWWRRSFAHVVALVLTSLLAGTASAPYGAYHFGHIQLYFIVANVVAVPLTAMWVMPLGLLGLVLMPFGLHPLALVPMGWGVQAVLWIGRTVSSWPAATLAVPPMPPWGLVVFSLGLAWLGLWRTRWRLLGVSVMLAGLLSPAASPRPDLLVSNDARLIALRSQGSYWVQARSGASKFTLAEWENHLGAGKLRPIRDGEPPVCTGASCRLGPVLVMRGTSRAVDCSGVALLVSAEPARGECPAGTGLLDRFTVWRDGAHAVWLERDVVRVLSDRTYRGERPWVPPPPKPHRNVPNLPMAPTEELPQAAEE
ncbi:MAG: ComEC/Rec2 family competence protein, partial [Acetobacteraceae bacterium]|nr:ComEC/Rec2 family competence protein [Acetobacteraceae bacterium]